MDSASVSLSSTFLSPKFAISSTPPPQCVRFRRRHCVSAAYTTAERSTTANRPHSLIATSTSLYEVLGIQMGATCLEVKTAYRRLARVLHPDVASDGRKDASADEFIRIHAAYSTLSDPEKRADYDRTLIWRQSMSVMPSASVLSGYARRSWETDQCWLYLKEYIATRWFDRLINKDVKVGKESVVPAPCPKCFGTADPDSDFDH